MSQGFKALKLVWTKVNKILDKPSPTCYTIKTWRTNDKRIYSQNYKMGTWCTWSDSHY